MTITIVEGARAVTGGVDTHLEFHVAAALDPVGALLGTAPFPTTPGGYKALLGWLESFGPVAKVGVEGTGSYGAGLSKFLARTGISVLEVNRPNREERRRSGKSDPLDAIEAARAALGGKAKSIPKAKDGAVEAIRALLVAKRSACTARTSALIQMRELIVTAPDQLRSRLRGLSISALTAEAARLRPARQGDPVLIGTKAALASLAHRVQELDGELAELDARIEVLLRRGQSRAPALGAGLGTPVRRGPHPDRVGADLWEGPARSRWRSPGQRGPLAHRHGSHRPPSRDHRLLPPQAA